MYITEHQVEPSFTVDDLNRILSKHQERVLCYEFIFKAIDTKPLLEVFESMRSGHKDDMQRLRELIRLYDGDVTDYADSVNVIKKMRLLISARMSSALELVDEMRHQENLLVDEYIKNFKNLTRIRNLEPVLQRNFQNARQRVDELTVFIENNSNL